MSITLTPISKSSAITLTPISKSSNVTFTNINKAPSVLSIGQSMGLLLALTYAAPANGQPTTVNITLISKS